MFRVPLYLPSLFLSLCLFVDSSTKILGFPEEEGGAPVDNPKDIKENGTKHLCTLV